MRHACQVKGGPVGKRSRVFGLAVAAWVARGSAFAQWPEVRDLKTWPGDTVIYGPEVSPTGPHGAPNPFPVTGAGSPGDVNGDGIPDFIVYATPAGHLTRHGLYLGMRNPPAVLDFTGQVGQAPIARFPWV